MKPPSGNFAGNNGRQALSKAAQPTLVTLWACCFSLFVLVPFAWVIFTAVKSRWEVPRNPLGIPAEWHWENFSEAWRVGHFDRYFLNSVYVVIPTVIIILAFATTAAFAFSQLRFKGKNILFAILLIGLTVPLDILIIPLFYSLLDMGLVNTHWALILPQAAAILPFGILLLRSFMEDIPGEILDSARIDGCTTLGLLYHIIVPLSKPALASLLVFSFMWTWNQFLLPVVLIQDDLMRTLPVGLNYFQGRYSTNMPLLMAGASISLLPIVIIYIIFQRQFIKGITAGALK